MSRCVWDLPGSGIDPVSPALAGGFFTTEPPHQGSSCMVNTVQISFICSLTITMSFFSFILQQNFATEKLRVIKPCLWPQIQTVSSGGHQSWLSSWLAATTFHLPLFPSFQFSSVHFSHSAVSDSLRLHESQHARPPCPSPTPGVHPNSCPSSQ